jgi:hypothetical protein
MTDKTANKTMTAKAAVELSDDALDRASGGLLLPAVQAAREAARRSTSGGMLVTMGDGSVRSTTPD